MCGKCSDLNLCCYNNVNLFFNQNKLENEAMSIKKYYSSQSIAEIYRDFRFFRISFY